MRDKKMQFIYQIDSQNVTIIKGLTFKLNIWDII